MNEVVTSTLRHVFDAIGWALRAENKPLHLRGVQSKLAALRGCACEATIRRVVPAAAVRDLYGAAICRSCNAAAQNWLRNRMAGQADNG